MWFYRKTLEISRCDRIINEQVLKEKSDFNKFNKVEGFIRNKLLLEFIEGYVVGITEKETTEDRTYSANSEEHGNEKLPKELKDVNFDQEPWKPNQSKHRRPKG